MVAPCKQVGLSSLAAVLVFYNVPPVVILSSSCMQEEVVEEKEPYMDVEGSELVLVRRLELLKSQLAQRRELTYTAEVLTAHYRAACV